MKYLLILSSLLFIFVACQVKNNLSQNTSKEEVIELMAYLSNLEEEQMSGESYQAFVDRIYHSVNIPLQKTSSPEVLKNYFYTCEKEKNKKLAPIILQQTQESILFSLAELKTKAAAKTLVEIYADQNINFDASYALALGESMVLCGDLIIEPLEKQKAVRLHISQRVLECIYSGKSFL